MFHLDGSEISWLVYADWLDDQDKDGQVVRQLLNDDENEANDFYVIFASQTGKARVYGGYGSFGVGTYGGSMFGQTFPDRVGPPMYGNFGVGGLENDTSVGFHGGVGGPI